MRSADRGAQRRDAGAQGGRAEACYFYFRDTATTGIYTLSLHDALPISATATATRFSDTAACSTASLPTTRRSEEHTSELQSPDHLVCRLLLEKKKSSDLSGPRGAETRAVRRVDEARRRGQRDRVKPNQA